MTPAEARRIALMTLGGLHRAQEIHRARRRVPLLDMLIQNVRYAVRAIARSPGFSAVVILLFALGIGGTTAIFSVIDAMILRPLAYPAPSRLFAVHEVLPQLPTPVVPVNAIHFREWRSATQSFESMALLFGSDVNVTSVGDPERIHSARVSPSLFPMLGVRAQLGRTFFEEEDGTGRDRVVVLSHELWRRRSAEDPRIIGRTIELDGEAHAIVGVLPPSFALPKLKHLYERPNVAQVPQLLRPFALWHEPTLSGWFGFACIARVKPGIPASQALADLNAIQANLAIQFRQKSQFQTLLVPLQDQIISRSRSGLSSCSLRCSWCCSSPA
jgi:putative ABC transport system permease protein